MSRVKPPSTPTPPPGAGDHDRLSKVLGPDDLQWTDPPLDDGDGTLTKGLRSVNLRPSDLFEPGFSVASERKPHHWWILPETSIFRRCWLLGLSVLLIYVGTIFIFRLCFVELKLELPMTDDQFQESVKGEQKDGWYAFDQVVNGVFWVDLVVHFFFSFKDRFNEEIFDPKRCALHYLKSTFLINLAACFPPELMQVIVLGSTDTEDKDGLPLVNAGLRLGRLQRITRLAKVMRVTSLLKFNIIGDWMTYFEEYKGARIMKLGVGLVWLVHLLACGWYLVAAIHEEPLQTWVARRPVDAAGETFLISRPSGDQWVHSMYFVFTVFTTVGFGDMSAMTIGEMLYVIFLMIVGVVFHSMIISEVITVLSSNDRITDYVETQRQLVDDFAKQTAIAGPEHKELQRWVYRNAHEWFKVSYSKNDMRMLITDKNMPNALMDKVPTALFEGRLLKSRLFTQCAGICNTPPRLVILLAMSLGRVGYTRGEILYYAQDFPFTLFLVFKGNFAYVVDAGGKGGNKGARLSVDTEMSMFPYYYFGPGTYFGETEIFDSCPRRATVRCESTRGGETLTLSRVDLKSLVSEFPEYTAQWVRRVKLREARRIKFLRQHAERQRAGHILSIKEMAVIKLQRWGRELIVRQRSEMRSEGVGHLSLLTANAEALLDQAQLNVEDAPPSSPVGINVNVGASSSSISDLAGKLDALTQKVDALSGLERKVNHILDLVKGSVAASTMQV